MGQGEVPLVTGQGWGACCLQADWLREGNPTTLGEEQQPLPTLELGRAAVPALLWNTTVSLPRSERGGPRRAGTGALWSICLLPTCLDPFS